MMFKKFPVFLYLSIILILLLSGCYRQIKPSENIRISSISFEGNYSISDKKLKEVLPVKEGEDFVEGFLREGIKRIISFYKSKGFFDIRIKKREGKYIKERNEVKITYHLYEGMRSKVSNIEVKGAQLLSDKKVKKIMEIREGDYYDEAKIGLGEYNLSRRYAERGYADAVIKVDKEVVDSISRTGKVRLSVGIQEGSKIWVRDIKFKGLKRVRSSIVKRELRIERGDLYRPSLIYKSQSNLYRTELFTDIDVQEKKVAGDSVDLVFALREEESRFFQFGLGYESPSKLLVNARWGDLNIFGNLQKLIVDLSLAANPDGEHWENLRVTYRESYLLGSSFSLVASPALERASEMEYRETDISFDLLLEREIFIQSRISLLYNFRRATIDTLGSSVGSVDLSIPANITNRLILRYYHEERDNIVNPRNGFRLLAEAEYAGGILSGDNHYDRLKLDFAKYFPFPFGSVLASRISTIYTFPRENPFDISTDVRQEMGGYSSLRGYEEASIGYPDIRGRKSGIYQLLFNTEYRIPVFKKLFSTFYIDAGNLWMEKENITLSEMKFGMGFGVGYITPIGAIRLDYARALGKTEKNYRGKIYLNFGHPF